MKKFEVQVIYQFADEEPDSYVFEVEAIDERQAYFKAYADHVDDIEFSGIGTITEIK